MTLHFGTVPLSNRRAPVSVDKEIVKKQIIKLNIGRKENHVGTFVDGSYLPRVSGAESRPTKERGQSLTL